MSANSKANARAQKAAELRAAQAKRENRRRLLTIVGVVAVMVLIVGGAIGISLLNKKDVKAVAAGSSDYGVTIGDKNAPHSVIIYEDFLCPYCGALEAETRGDLADLAADGKVLVEYRPFNLLGAEGRTYSIRAANAFALVLEKSGPDVAKKFHDLLFENQPSEANADAEAPNDDIIALAVEAGASESDVRDGVDNLSHEDWVTKATDEAHKANVQGTPTIILDGEVFDDGRSVQDLADNLIAAVD
ncbi:MULTISPECIES: DsbA family protein [unclassified Nocardioides]|uniref:DsbA family protein n=1 Tax=unclassified Nocardioides TaxID=2615069 RepID=UPI0006FC4E41|nr:MULTISPECIES: thioredoxin domain-containing protein [unclassified Nocardioides]KRA38109.1 disulfide bond formation protein DsbA [Nocardioides sp. Root614]KRA92069.1 disulfide bond formation protein DsbA [Nocardioides sp. Root682]